MADANRGPGKWIVIVLFLWTPALAIDRDRLDRCQAQLGVCYDACKARGTSPKVCNRKCTTRLCGLPWREAYGAFLDRRIEENAAKTRNKFIGLKRLKGQRPGQDRQLSEESVEEGGPIQSFFSFFGLQ